MSLDACAALVARADPDRWAAVLAAPVPARPALIVLYAFNAEIARAPWASSQPLFAQMRLQWWRDAIVAPTAPAHEIAAPLHELIAQKALDRAVLDRMVAARSWDVYSDPFDSAADFDTYLDDTAGGLASASAQALGAPPKSEPIVRAFGQAAGLAAFLRAAGELRARGRVPLQDDSDAAIATAARNALKKLSLARSKRREIGPAWPALLASVSAAPLLRCAAKAPHLVRQGNLSLPPAQARARLIWAAFTARV